MSCIDVDNSNFKEEVLESELPVLVDFWAPWCQYCLMISDDIEDISDELDGEINVCKLNCDEARDIALSHGVMSIPCLILFKGGKEADRLTGVFSRDEIDEFIESNK